jgi:Cdc6-like AAA superfamily ATPase
MDRITDKQNDREWEAILDWLSIFSVDYSSQQNNVITKRQEGTWKSLFRLYNFHLWEKNKKSTLFLPGSPGAGKTMISSIVVDHLFKKFGNDPGTGIAFLYCNFWQQKEQRLIDLFFSLLKQFFQRQPLLPECVTRLHREWAYSESFDLVSDALYQVVASFSRAFIVIDGLDECSATDGVLSRFMKELFSLQANTGCRIFATSRPILGIPEEFQRQGSSILKIRASEEDMQRYLDGHIKQVSIFVREVPGIERKIRSAITKAADGM